MMAAAVLPETPPPAPRPFRFRAIGAMPRFLLLLDDVLTIVGGMMSTICIVGGAWDDILLDRCGVTTKGAVALIEPTWVRSNGRQMHRVRYTFTDAGGVEHAGSGQTTDPDRIARLWGPFDLSIDYDPRAPQRSRLSGESPSRGTLAVLISHAIAAAGVIVFLFGVRGLLAVRRVYVHGQPAGASVTAVVPTMMTLNRRRVMRVDYAFDTIMGRATGSTTSVDPPPVGGTLWVLHLPSEPKRNVAA